MNTDQRQTSFQLSCPSLGDVGLAVSRIHGYEEISQPFRYEIELYSDDPDIAIDQALAKPATLTIHCDGAERAIHGVISEYHVESMTADQRHYLYRIILSPRFWLLSLSRQSQIYGTDTPQTVPDIVQAELTGKDRRGPAEMANPGLSSADFDLRLTREYRRRDYTVQYQESDLNFVQRLLEDEGIFYLFDHTQQHDRVLFCDNNPQTPEITNGTSIPFNAQSGMLGIGDRGVSVFHHWGRARPRKMLLRDYNYRLPQVSLLSESDIDTSGHGVVADFGSHFRAPEEGDILAGIRAEEIRTHSQGYTGETNAIEMTAGHRFTLTDHPSDANDGEYLLTRIDVEASQPRAGAAQEEGTIFHCRFNAHPIAEPFRPARRTERPRLSGIMNAHIDAETLTGRAEIDEEGRYKVVMPFDLSGSLRGKASRYMRLAQPYSGPRQGMHFPLHPGTEVLWACIDGDPDRPILCGAVPNPVNPSVVTNSNRETNRLQTASGIVMELSDGRPRRRNSNAGSGTDNNLTPQRNFSSADQLDWSESSPLLAVQRNQDGPTTNPENNANDQEQPNDEEQPDNDQSDEIYLKLEVPSHAPSQAYERGFRDDSGDAPESNTVKANNLRSYLRIGALPEGAIVAGSSSVPIIDSDDGRKADTSGLSPAELRRFREDGEDLASHITEFYDDTIKRGPHIDAGDDDAGSLRRAESDLLHLRGGWRDHTDGNRITTTRGDKVEIIGGNYKMLVLGREARADDSGWEASGGHTMEIGSYDEITWTEKFGGTWMTRESEDRGDSYSYSEGYSFEFGRGRSEEIYCGEQFSYFGPIAPPYDSASRGTFPPEYLSRIQAVLPDAMFDGEWGQRITDATIPDENSECVAREVSIATSYAVSIGDSYETVYGGSVSETFNGTGLAKEFSWNGRVESIEVTGGSANFAIGGSDITLEMSNFALSTSTATSTEIAAALAIEIFLGGKIEVVMGPSIEVRLGKVMEISPGNDTEVSGSKLQACTKKTVLSAISHNIGAVFLGT